MTSAESKVLYDKRGEIAYVTLNRPQKLNAIDDDVEEQLFQAWTRFREDSDVRLVNTCGVGIAMELELMGEPVSAQRAKECHLVNRVVPREDLMATVEGMAAKILRNPRIAVESAKETILEVVGRPLDDQLRLECLYGYSIMGDPQIIERRNSFFAQGDPASEG